MNFIPMLVIGEVDSKASEAILFAVSLAVPIGMCFMNLINRLR